MVDVEQARQTPPSEDPGRFMLIAGAITASMRAGFLAGRTTQQIRQIGVDYRREMKAAMTDPASKDQQPSGDPQPNEPSFAAKLGKTAALAGGAVIARTVLFQVAEKMTGNAETPPSRKVRATAWTLRAVGNSIR